MYFGGLAKRRPVAHVRRHLHDRHLRCEFGVARSDIVDDFRFGVKVVDVGVLFLAQFAGTAQG